MKIRFIRHRKFRGKLEREPESFFIGDPGIDTSVVAKKILTVDQEGGISRMELKNIRQKKTAQKIDFRYIGLGYYLIIPLLLGVFGGLLVDKIFNTKPFFLVLFLVVGTAASFYNLLRVLRNE